jgi:hypothetical protein
VLTCGAASWTVLSTWLKRAYAKIMRRPKPKQVDIAKVLPLTYAAAVAMMITAGLLVYADLVNPLTLTN